MKARAKQLVFWLKASRPGLWFATGWLYLLPTSQSAELLGLQFSIAQIKPCIIEVLD